LNSVGEYCIIYHEHFQYFGTVTQSRSNSNSDLFRIWSCIVDLNRKRRMRSLPILGETSSTGLYHINTIGHTNQGNTRVNTHTRCRNKHIKWCIQTEVEQKYRHVQFYSV
jgi:hypothetical protein